MFPRNLITRCADAYRRVRNTYRYLLSNLYDFNPKADSVPLRSSPEIDRWALHKTQELIKNVTAGYESLQFHKVFHTIYNFCSVEMRLLYLDILKDRLYTFGKNSVSAVPPDRSAVRPAQPRKIICAHNRPYGGRGLVSNPA